MQIVLVLLAVFCIPVMLLGKPLYLKHKHKAGHWAHADVESPTSPAEMTHEEVEVIYFKQVVC